jgi:hypothetical protein
MAEFLAKIWALIVSDPVDTIWAIAIVIGLRLAIMGALAAFSWWYRGFLDKNKIAAVEAQLRLANDKEKALREELEAVKKKKGGPESLP